MKEGDLLTIPTAARELQVSHMTIRRWIKGGHLHPIKPGHEYLIEREELERYRDPKARPQPGRPRKTLSYPVQDCRLIAESRAPFDPTPPADA